MPLRIARAGRVVVLLLVCGFVCQAAAQTNDLTGQTADSIRNVLNVVANHQLRELADGNYATVYTLSAATDALKPVGIEWNYPWGVNLYGLLQAKQATGDTNIENFVLNHNLIVGRYYAWLKSLNTSITNATATQIRNFQTNTALAEVFNPVQQLDYCGSITEQLLEGALNHASGPTTEQVQIGCTTASWVSAGQSRLPDGTLSRGNTLWADDLYMSCPFLLRWYLHTGNTNFLDDAARQIVNMAGYMQGTNGLWFHGYYSTTHTTNGIKWGRANGWAMVATAEVLSLLPLDHPQRSNVLSVLSRHIEGVKSVQAPSGLWRQVLDYPAAWEETSCSAMFTYCIARAVNRGWIDPTNMAVARQGFIGVCTKIQTNGVILGTCAGTGMYTDINSYLTRPTPVDDMHGRGAVMLAGAEILLSPKLSIASAGGPVEVSWNAGITNGTLETSSNLTTWAAFLGLVTVTNWQNIATAQAKDVQFYRLKLAQPTYPPAPLGYEAESLAYATNGATATLSSDTNASAGSLITFNGDGIGDYIEYTLSNVPAGAYRLRLAFQTATNRAQVNSTVDGSPLGNVLDQFWFTNNVYPLIDIGPVNFATAGDHVIRLTAGGKAGASKSYTVSADRFLLVPH